MSGIYGLYFKNSDAKLHYISVPWDVTTSYHPGTHLGPESIYQCSEQIDLFNEQYGKFYEKGLYWHETSSEILELNKKMRPYAVETVEGKANLSKEVNEASSQVNNLVYLQSKELIDSGKHTILVGGDHSTPYGHIKAYAEAYDDFGILHIDAHHDLRIAYQGFKHSHASIIYNVHQDFDSVSKITSVAIRDFCEEEFMFAKSSKKISTFYDSRIKKDLYSGKTWHEICQEIIETLPSNIYLSVDIDGLDPKLCPHTGTPVPGGLEYSQFEYLLTSIYASGKKVISADLVEVAPGKSTDWDSNVGMRVLFLLSGLVMKSNCK